MILFINGSSNSGKTTAANAILNTLPNTVIVEIDILIAGSAETSPEARLYKGIREGIDAIRHFATDRYKNIIVPFPLSLERYKEFKSVFEDLSHELIFTTLSPALEIALSNRGTRKLSSNEIYRIRKFYKLNLHQPSFGITIDNSYLSPQKTASIILEYCRKN